MEASVLSREAGPEEVPEFLCDKLNTVEVNFTFRQLVKETTVNEWIEETPAHFRFTIKAHQVLTHIKRLKGTEEFLRRFLTTLEALERAQKLGSVLFQLPPNFKADQAVLSEFLQTLPRSVRAAFEFRHASWFNEGTFDRGTFGEGTSGVATWQTLRERNVALCIAESEERDTPDVVTADYAYYRYRKPSYTSDERRAMVEQNSPALGRRPRRIRLFQARRNSRRRALRSRCIAELRSAERLSVSCSDAPVSLLLRFLSTADTHIVPSDTNARVLSGFLDYLRVERGSARLTIAAYTSDLGQFAEFLEKHIVC